MAELPSALEPLFFTVARGRGKIVVLTGAGISAESGIPTFRGPEGYWRIGSKNYHPMELATHQAFQAMPDAVWGWYLYRRGVCRAAAPNAAHVALVALERAAPERFVLITQNVDGLHLRAGSSRERTYQIHGNVDFMRCADECSPAVYEIPEAVPLSWEEGRPAGESEHRLLRCPRCDAMSRPHVLWFDETYDEPRFRFDSSRRAATEADLLIVIGSTGTTNLPLQVSSLVAHRGAPIVVVNPEPNPFAELAEGTQRGCFAQGTAGALVPPLAATLGAHLANARG